MVRNFSVAAYSTCRGVGAGRFGPNTAISSSFANVFIFSVVTTTIQTPQASRVIYTGGDDKKEAKGKKIINDNNDSKEGVNGSDNENVVDYFYDDCDERAEAGRSRVKSKRQWHEPSLNKKQKSNSKPKSNPPTSSGTAPNPNSMAKALAGKTT
ncbi:hypothetical protein EVAR_37505_1 [Eumeta japonica]|uniref:Uncharacterized protein n=1 Tax=Eumeta variegata TaxID=151549 RepID=A0A4C1XDR3_EUMVA|nr:hypothetical protein EVAR_37505_1 [Eumeta japonica]